jgi:cadmium resistance protein CadD (predicted permease)
MAQAKERKSDRRWMVGTFLTTASLIVAALAIFLG